MEIVRYEVVADYRENENAEIKVLVCAFVFFALGLMYTLYCFLSESDIKLSDLSIIGMLFLVSVCFFYWYAKLQNVDVFKFVEIDFNYIKYRHHLNEPETIIYFSNIDLVIYHPKRIIFRMKDESYAVLELAGFGSIKIELIKEKLQAITFDMDQMDFDELYWTDALKLLIDDANSANLN